MVPSRSWNPGGENRMLLEPGIHLRLVLTGGTAQCPELENTDGNGLAGFQVELLKRGLRLTLTHFCSGGGGVTLVGVVRFGIWQSIARCVSAPVNT